ncbi:MAG: cobalt ECF transporter T component CbiQ [Thermodesulfovibrionales bacterium]|nr:cobalt ECF transporter T component CbiQ [Thermodesulfovibrionales bacterium]
MKTTMELFSEYFKKDNVIARIDARVKLLVALVLLAMVLSYKGFVFPLLILGISLALCIWIRVPLRVFLMRFSEPVFIASVIVVLKLLFAGDDVFFSFSLPTAHFPLLTLTGHRDGVMEGLQIASRILGAVAIVAVMGFSTPFTEFVSALSWMKAPKGFIEILMFAYRYIFVFMEDAMVVYNAQKNRLGYTSIRRGLSSFGTLAGSLILKAFENSQHITTAMIQRGYDGNVPLLKHKPFSAAEIVVSILIVTAMGFVWKI